MLLRINFRILQLKMSAAKSGAIFSVVGFVLSIVRSKITEGSAGSSFSLDVFFQTLTEMILLIIVENVCSTSGGG